MAVVKLGSTIVGVRGTIGGITFGANKGGPTARCWSRPGKSATAWQGLARGNLSRWGAVWRSLSGAERGDWDLFAAAPPETDYDKFGFVVLRSGFQWLCRLNQRRCLLGMGVLSLAPVAVAQAVPVLTGFVCQCPTGTPGLTYVTHSNTEFGPSDFVCVFLSLIPSVGVTQVRRGFSLAGFYFPNGQTQTDFTGVAVLKYSWWPEGWQAVVRVYRQNPDGIRSVPGVASVVVTA